MEDPSLQPVFKITSHTEVWYCDRPLKFPGACPRKTPVVELEKIVGGGFKYSEDIYAGEFPNLSFLKSDLLQSLVKEILTQLKNPLTDMLVIWKIDDKVGHGVFTREPIEFNEIVAVYSDEFKLNQEEEDPSYGITAVKSQKNSGNFIDAKKIGGIARFFQHLPLNPDVWAQLY